MSRQEHLVMVQSFVGNAADMNEFLIASYKGFRHHHNIFNLFLGRFEYKSMSFAVWLWASLQFCFSCTSVQGSTDLTTYTIKSTSQFLNPDFRGRFYGIN